jgi:peptidoglycan hydrolase-like protein with peptidoglycan-binding domain
VKLLQSELRQLGYTISDKEFQVGVFDETTKEAIQTFQKKHEIEATGKVYERTATLINADFERLNFYIVKGQIRQANGSVSTGAIVAVYDKDLRSEQLLGQTKTDIHTTNDPNWWRKLARFGCERCIFSFGLYME